MISNSVTRQFETFGNRSNPIYVTSAIEAGKPSGRFSLGIPQDQIGGNPAYATATNTRMLTATAIAHRRIGDKNVTTVDNEQLPIIGRPPQERWSRQPGFNLLRLNMNNAVVGYVRNLEVCDPLFVKEGGIYKPIAYMVFIEISPQDPVKGSELRYKEAGYLPEDEKYRALIPDSFLYKGSGPLTRRADGNWVSRVTISPNASSTVSEEELSIEENEESSSNDQEKTIRILGSVVIQNDVPPTTFKPEESDSEPYSDSADIDMRLLNNAAMQPQTAVWRQGSPLFNRGETCMRQGALLGSIAILAWLSYQAVTTPRPETFSEPDPNFDSSVSHAFEKCAQALGFEPHKEFIESFTYLLRDSYSRALSHIKNVGNLLECDPDKLTKNLGSIFQSYERQMEAMKSASADVLSPNACLILFSLVALLMQMGMI